ncbi:uncharacterized protein LOC132281104 [Cornus florida]|uniref:uncharacterized protein LOC132281104 n=1 Tax=Cornus florida TaxID=4283 RepID=UPI00289E2450|nr:uncharacterized protein LOC132281104 [Cornus florida]
MSFYCSNESQKLSVDQSDISVGQNDSRSCANMPTNSSRKSNKVNSTLGMKLINLIN